MCSSHAQTTTESTPDVSSKQEIRASVLHGARDLRIVGYTPLKPLKAIFNSNSRNLDQSFHLAQQTFKSAFAPPASAVLIFTTIDTIAMGTFLYKSPSHLATSRLVLWSVLARTSKTSVLEIR